jgi:hypothetical protein
MDHESLLNRTLAADFRFTQIDLKNDQVWEFTCSGGEPPAVAVQTTYGLKCQGIKVFPRFTFKGTTLTDPRTFAAPVKIEKRFTNYISLFFSPFPLIDVQIEYWVPGSTSICGRTRLVNHNPEAIALTVDWSVLLKPKGPGESMTGKQIGINTVLSGKAAELCPVFFLTGGPVPSTKAYPALALDMTLPAGAERRVSWALASLDSQEASFTLARQNTALAWDTEILKHEMEEKRRAFLFSSQDTGLDEMLYESQVKAHQCLLVGPGPERRLLLLAKRQPDQPTGSEMVVLKNRQANLTSTAYELWLASRILLPAQVDLFKELVKVYIDQQRENGAIPWKINSLGVPVKAMMPPLLAGIVRDAAENSPDIHWLAQIYAPLLDAFKYWFVTENEPVNNFWPTWDHLLQTGMDSSPLYSIWNEDDPGLDVKAVDSPALGAMLYHECQALLQIAYLVEQKEEIPWLMEKAEFIKAHVQKCWNEEKGTYCYQDIVSGCREPSAPGMVVRGDGIFTEKIECGSGRRLIVRCVKKESFPTGTIVEVQGRVENKDLTEEFSFTPGNFRDGIARATSINLFSSIQQVKVAGLREGERVEISLAGFDEEDLSLLLPLWAGIPSTEQAERIVNQTLMRRYFSPLGLSNVPIDRYPPDRQIFQSIWNSLLVEGMLTYGMREQASRVLLAYYGAVKSQRQRNYYFNEMIRADGKGMGNRDSLSSLPPILPLLNCLGIEKIDTKEILLGGLNIYLPSFTVQYGRINLNFDPDRTTVSTTNGSKIDVNNAGKQRVVLP